jgi:hypothetical protein
MPNFVRRGMTETGILAAAMNFDVAADRPNTI